MAFASLLAACTGSASQVPSAPPAAPAPAGGASSPSPKAVAAAAAVVTDDGKLSQWSPAAVTEAATQCTSDLARVGLELDDGTIGKTCGCLLQTFASLPFANFAPSLPTLVATKFANGSIKGCLEQAGFDVDKVNQRQWQAPVLAATYDAGTLTNVAAAFDATATNIGVIWVLTDPNDASGGPELWARVYNQASGAAQPGQRIGHASSYLGAPHLVFFADGSAHVFWSEMTMSGPVIYTSTYSTTWSSPANVGGKTFLNVNGTDFTFSVDGTGRVVAAHVDATNPSLVIVDECDDGQTWLPAKALNAPGPASATRLALGGAGSLAAGWVANGGLFLSGLASGAWSAPDLTGAPAVDGPSLSLAIDRADYDLATWLDGSQQQISAVRHTGLLGFEPVAKLAAGPNVGSPAVIATEAGAAVAVWMDGPSGQRVVSSATMHVFNGWGPPKTLGAPAATIDSLTVVPGDAGVAIAVWSVSTGGKNGRLYIAAFE